MHNAIKLGNLSFKTSTRSKAIGGKNSMIYLQAFSAL